MELILNSSDRKRKETITDTYDFEQLCNEKLDLFVKSIQSDKRYCYPITKEMEEDYPYGSEWAFTTNGALLYERFENRLHQLGIKYFGENEMFFIDIGCSFIIDE